jgi:chemotaxis protein methyltransferase CheR
MSEPELEELEADLLLEAVFRCYGHDFRSYAKAIVRKRLRHFADKNGCPSISGLIPQVLHDAALFQALLFELSVSVTQMFRDPAFYRALREQVLPILKTYPSLRIWHAGCATGEEAYSMAILLHEEGLLERSVIYATDINSKALGQAKQGLLPKDMVSDYGANYQQSGARHSLSHYYHFEQDCAVMNRDLAKHITFADHNLVIDQVFGEMHLILCRNVLIYFNHDLKNQVLGLLDNSLIRGGFLCLGSGETLFFFKGCRRYREIDRRQRIYRKRFLLQGEDRKE